MNNYLFSIDVIHVIYKQIFPKAVTVFSKLCSFTEHTGFIHAHKMHKYVRIYLVFAVQLNVSVIAITPSNYVTENLRKFYDRI